jgi:hypothetical protein
MINLLPLKEKKEFFSRRKRIAILIFWILVLFFFISFSLVVFFVKYYLQLEIISQKDLINSSGGESFQGAVQSVSVKIDSINKDLTALDIFYKKNINFYDVVERISSIMPQGVYLSSFNAETEEQADKEILNISISGFAPTREALFEFKNKLEAENEFKNTYFPPANWIKPSDIDFIVTLKFIP